MDEDLQAQEDSATFYKRHELALISSRQDAMWAVDAMDLPMEVEIHAHNFESLPPLIRGCASRQLEFLKVRHPVNIWKIIGVSIWHCHFTVCASAFYRRAISGGQTSVPPAQLASIEGWASLTYEGLATDAEDELFKIKRLQLGIDERLTSQDILTALSIHWFAKAATLNAGGQPLDAQSWIFEAMDAIAAELGLAMWEDGAESASEINSRKIAPEEARTLLALAGATARQAGNRAIRAHAIELYQAGAFPSRHRASILLVEPVLAHAKQLGKSLSRDRAQKTIYDWLRNADKQK